MRTTEVNISQQDLVARADRPCTIELTKREAELSSAARHRQQDRGDARRDREGRTDRGAERSRVPHPAGAAVANKQTEGHQVRETRRIEADLEVKRRTTEMERDLQIVAQESAVAVAMKSKEQSEAQTIAETARAHAIAAEEKVTTARAAEVAERDRLINASSPRARPPKPKRCRSPSWPTPRSRRLPTAPRRSRRSPRPRRRPRPPRRPA